MNENTPNVIDNETIISYKVYTINHDCTLIKIANEHHNRTALPPTNTFTNERQYLTNKHIIDIMGKIVYSRTSIYNSENEKRLRQNNVIQLRRCINSITTGLTRVMITISRNIKRCTKQKRSLNWKHQLNPK